MASLGNYGRYNSTVKTVLQAVEAAHNGYHQSANDLDALRYAIEDLQGILDQHNDPQAWALVHTSEDGTKFYAPSVFIKDSGRNYMAYTRHMWYEDKQEALTVARDAIDSKAWQGDLYTAYTNSAGTIEWLEASGYTQ